MNEKIEKIIQETKDLINDKRDEGTLLKAYVVLANNTEEIIAENERLEKELKDKETETVAILSTSDAREGLIEKLQRVCDCVEKIDFDTIDDWHLANKSFSTDLYDDTQTAKALKDLQQARKELEK